LGNCWYADKGGAGEQKTSEAISDRAARSTTTTAATLHKTLTLSSISAISVSSHSVDRNSWTCGLSCRG